MEGERGCGWMWWLLVVVVMAAPLLTQAYNLDTEDPILLRPPSQTDIHFGFSLAHFFNGTERRLLVGAPRANTTQNVKRPGALYSCSLDGLSPECRQLQIKQKDKYKPWITDDIKDGQGLGYSVASDGNRSIVVCAPRWHMFLEIRSGKRDLPFGMCFAAKAPDYEFEAFSLPTITSEVPAAQGCATLSSRNRWIPLKQEALQRDWPFHFFNPVLLTKKGITIVLWAAVSFINNGTCQFGMSIAYVKGQDAVTFGSPGCWNWQGDTWEVSLDSLENEESLKYSLRRVKQLSLGDMDLVYSSSSSGFETVTDLYLGYSVASITYNGTPAIVSSMPRTISTSELRVNDKNTTLGPFVYIFREDPNDRNKLQVLEKITPSASAESSIKESRDNKFTYFGYSLATVDVNGDGLEDVIVGAPFYHNDTHHDQGAIFIYLQQTVSLSGDSSQQKSSEIKEQKNAPCRIGQESYGRFGSCVAAVGDLDNDGFHDVAVGAPFLPDGGAVFIYMGSRDGLEVAYRQVIYAAELSTHVTMAMPLHGFGSSIAQQLPADSGLGYDVAVGAHSSDAVVVFRSKEIINLSWNLTFSGPMDLTKKSCDYTDSKGQVDSYPCVNVTVCLISFKSISKEINNQKLEFSLILNADINEQMKRLFFDSGTARLEKLIKLQEGIEKCEYYRIMAKKDIEEVVKSFIIQGKTEFNNKDGGKIMLSQHAKLLKEEKLDILVFCKSDDVHECQSDIYLSYNILRNYTLKATQPIVISFMLENRGEAAYNTELIIDSMGDLAASESSNGISCENLNKEKKIRCEIATIFMTNSKMQFSLSMTPVTEFFDSLEQQDDVFHIKASVITTSVLANADAAIKTFQIPITVEGTLDLTKEPSFPGIVYYNSSSYYKVPSEAKVEEELGPEITHKYKIFNGNKFSIYKTQVTIKWPLMIHGKYLFYLLDEPDFGDIISDCLPLNGEVNPFNLKKNASIQRNRREVLSGPTEVEMKMANDRSTRDSGLMDKMIEYMELDCTFKEISAGGELLITLRSRLVQRTISELGMGSDLRNASSWAQLKVLQMPLGADPPAASHTSSVTTEISYQNESPEWVVPWWVYLVSVLGGLLVLVVIILIMWKCGFFKRKRVEKPDSMMEKKREMQAVMGDDEEDPQTPQSPMMKMTENANDDFQYSRPSSWVPT